LIDKKISHRLFDKDQAGNFRNPGPGTVLDSGLVENAGETTFDFLMIPHNATIATALPVHFDVVYNTTMILKKDIELLTYHLCYGYANFCGPVKVPAACKYAEKLVNYAHEMKIIPNTKLSLNLHYL
jgi:aubergine